MFRQDRTNPSTAVSNWKGRRDTPKAWPSTAVSTWLNGGLYGAPDTGSWVALYSNVLGSDTASVTISSSGSEVAWTDFQDLVLVAAMRNTGNGNSFGNTTTFNSDTSSKYFWQTMAGDGSAVAASKADSQSSLNLGTMPGDDMTANFFSATVVHIYGATNTNVQKMMYVYDGNSTGDGSEDNNVAITMNRYKSTSALTTFTMNPTNSFKSGSTFHLYGVKAYS